MLNSFVQIIGQHENIINLLGVCSQAGQPAQLFTTPLITNNNVWINWSFSRQFLCIKGQYPRLDMAGNNISEKGY
jgi:hypothetical protein